MSYNIDNIEIISQKDFGIDKTLYQTIKEHTRTDNLPEGNIFEENWDMSKGIWWYGEGSGHAFHHLKNILAAFDGEADLVLIWEGGDSFTGLRLKNHVVTEHKVNFSLGEVVRR